MSVYKKTEQVTAIQQVIANLTTAASELGSGFGDKSTVNTMLTMESAKASDVDVFVGVEQNIRDAVKESGLEELLSAVIAEKAPNRERCIAAGIEMAVATLLANADPESYHTAYLSSATDAAINANASQFEMRVVNDDGGVLTLEGFEKADLGQYVQVSAVANALAAATNPMNEGFFRTVVLPATSPGIDIDVRVPVVYNKRARSADASKYSLVKTPITHAYVDHTILENNALELIPYAKPDGSFDSKLVDKTIVADRVVRVNGLDVATRPIRFGVSVDLLAVTGHPGIPSAGTQDETDTINPALSIGEAFFNVTDGTETGVASFDLSYTQGSLFVKRQDGNINNAVASVKTVVTLRSDSEAEDGRTFKDALAAFVTAGAFGSGDFAVDFEVVLTGNLHQDDADLDVHFVAAQPVAFYLIGTGGALTKRPIEGTIATAMALLQMNGTGCGFFPVGSRTNSTMRTIAQVCDAGTTIRYRIPVRPRSPLVALMPTAGENGAATMDTMVLNKRVREFGESISEILRFETLIAAGGGANLVNSMAGAQLVEPTYLVADLDVKDQTIIHQSGNGMDDLRAVLVDAVSIMVNRLVLESNYLSALLILTGSDSNYEAIIGTDPHIASHLMYGGDGRTIGNDRKFTITRALDKRIRNKIYIALRRTDTEQPNPLDFGVFGTMAPLMYSAQTTRGDSTKKEVHMIPRSKASVICPILGRINVKNIDLLFGVQ